MISAWWFHKTFLIHERWLFCEHFGENWPCYNGLQRCGNQPCGAACRLWFFCNRSITRVVSRARDGRILPKLATCSPNFWKDRGRFPHIWQNFIKHLYWMLPIQWTEPPFSEILRGKSPLTHWGRDKMAVISQTILSNAISWMQMLEFRLKFHWSLFLRVQLTI